MEEEKLSHKLHEEDADFQRVLKQLNAFCLMY